MIVYRWSLIPHAWTHDLQGCSVVWRLHLLPWETPPSSCQLPRSLHLTQPLARLLPSETPPSSQLPHPLQSPRPPPLLDLHPYHDCYIFACKIYSFNTGLVITTPKQSHLSVSSVTPTKILQIYTPSYTCSSNTGHFIRIQYSITTALLRLQSFTILYWLERYNTVLVLNICSSLYSRTLQYSTVHMRSYLKTRALFCNMVLYGWNIDF